MEINKNISCNFSYSLAELIEFLLFVLLRLSSQKLNVGVIIEDDNLVTVYKSKSYDHMIDIHPEIQTEIDKIIIERNYGYRHVGLFDIYSCISDDTQNVSKISCVVIINSSPDLQNVISGRCYQDVQKCYHDVQEPLRSISNFLQLLSEQAGVKQDSESSEYISYAMDNIEKLRSWISEFLLFPSTSSERQISQTQYTIVHVIREIELLLRYQMEKRHCSIDVDCTIPLINCPKNQAVRLFKNLIENSLNHAITNDNLEIKIYQNLQKTTEEFVTIIFEDNGKYEESSSINSNKYGLGLSICLDIVKANNGYIQNIGQHKNQYKYEIILPRSKNHGGYHDA